MAPTDAIGIGSVIRCSVLRPNLPSSPIYLLNYMKRLAIIAVLLLSGCILPSIVTSVTDGDTFRIRKTVVRMDDIDCPEIDQPYGIQAKEYLEQMILKKEVTLWGDEIDFFGRRLATVYVNGIDVNELMIAEGYCWWYKKYSDNDDYEDWEQIARDKRRGLWGQDDPIPPWEFRRQNK